MNMSIAALSVAMHQQDLQQNIGTSVLKNQLNDMSASIETILPATGGAIDPSRGINLDILV